MATRNIQYSEEKSIGRGTFGKIYRAKRRDSKGSESIVAIKKIDLRKCNQKDQEHAQREADVLQACHHENLVQYLDSFTKDDYLNIVMELCNRGNLRTLISDEEGLDEKQFIDILSKIVQGLKYLHDKNIIHRDVKTTNILLHEQNGELLVKIGDFGLAKVMDMSSPTMNVGSPYFMSPEMMNGKEYDMRTDIWSLGCCAYEMATTLVPYEAAKEIESLQRLKNEGKVDSSKIPYCDQMKDLITAMMSNEPTRRPNIEQILSFLQQHDSDTHKTRIQARHEDLMVDVKAGADDLVVDVKVRMTQEEADWFLKAEQLQIDIKKRLNDKDLINEMNEALNRTKHMDNETQFLADMEEILGGTMFKKCRPDLKALWGYQTEILKRDFKIVF